MKCCLCIWQYLLAWYFLLFGYLATSTQRSYFLTTSCFIVLLCWLVFSILLKRVKKNLVARIIPPIFCAMYTKVSIQINLKILCKIFGRLKNLPYICVVNVWQTIRSVGILHPTRYFFYYIYKKIVKYYLDNSYTN